MKKTKGKCEFDYLVVRVWTVSDSCGNSASMHQSIWVTDHEPPVMDPVPEPATFPCTEYSSLPSPADPQCFDNCGVYASHPVAQYTSEKHAGSCADDWIFIRTYLYR